MTILLYWPRNHKIVRNHDTRTEEGYENLWCYFGVGTEQPRPQGFYLGTRLGEEVSIADQSQSRGLLHSGTEELKATVRSNTLYMTREFLVGRRLLPCNVWSILEVINMKYYPDE